MTELRTTWRQLLRAPAHVATVVASLGIAMAVCGAVFSALNALLFSDVPGVVDRNSLVRIRWAGQAASFTPAEFDALATALAGDTGGAAAQGESDRADRPPGRSRQRPRGLRVGRALRDPRHAAAARPAVDAERTASREPCLPWSSPSRCGAVPSTAIPP